jgi:glycosyltransferase involved in cell wall biosynthesis
VVLIAPHLRAYYQRHGAALPRATRVQHPFIAPPLEEEEEIGRTYPPDVLDFVADRQPLVIANAFRITFDRGLDLYGLDMCVELVARLKETHPRVGLLFALSEIGDRPYYAEINRRIDALGVRDSFHFMTGQRELWPLFRRADLMVRPTSNDGYGISIAEALYFGCPAVASDVCERPPGTVLFATRDPEDFLRKCLDALG